MSGAIPPFPHTPPWRGAQLKHRDNFNFYLYQVMLQRSSNLMVGLGANNSLKKKRACYEMLHRATELAGCREHDNEPSGCI
jgi:hypothetical protein